MNRQRWYITVTVIFKQEKDDIWTAECKELGTATFGHSLQEAKECIEEAIELHLDSLERNGQIERFFKENDIVMIKERPRLNHSVNINIPVNPNIFVQSSIHTVHSLVGAC
ncbi:type II toxin-antitoxin system HicB family antitoxin [bacterium]|nr:type II toxin-antitoxin system HicB family antitoxin [bacterium]